MPRKNQGNMCFINYASNCKNWTEPKMILNRHQNSKKQINLIQRWNDYRLVQQNNDLSVANQVCLF